MKVILENWKLLVTNKLDKDENREWKFFSWIKVENEKLGKKL